MIECPRNRDDCEKVSESVPSISLQVPAAADVEMTPSLITAIHVPRNNYATMRVVTRLAFLSYAARSWPTLVFVDDDVCLIGELITTAERVSDMSEGACLSH